MKLKNNLYAVILAGGSGTRFWPMSRKNLPKQFLNVIGDATLLAKTVERIKGEVFPSNIYIVTNVLYKGQVIAQIKRFKIPIKNILLEPEGKNTAPAIAWAASIIQRINPQGIMMVFPSDHLIVKQKEFLNCLRQAVHLAQQDYLVTLGIVPARPETGYGYMKVAKKNNIHEVIKFIEKPSLKAAKKFLKAKTFYWNSGMFIWKTEVILGAFDTFLPDVARLLKQGAYDISKVWGKMPKISIDCGILEKAKRVASVPADIGWSDLGSWESLSEVLPKNKEQNISQGQVLHVGSKNNLVFANGRFIAVVGVSDLVIVDTPDALLVMRKDSSQNVREVVAYLERNRRKEI